MIALPADFRDLLVEFADAQAEFVVIGGHAVAYDGHPRATKDLDVLVRAEPDNARTVYRALASFGVPLATFEVDASDPGHRPRCGAAKQAGGVEIVGGPQDPADFSLKFDLALRENGRRTLQHQLLIAGATPWWPRIGLGDDTGPQLWWALRPVLVGWGFPCSYWRSNIPTEDSRQTTLTTICARLPMLLADGMNDVSHAHLDLQGMIHWWAADAVVASIGIVYHGGV